MDYNFKGKRALVTGAGRGIGRELTKRLISSGADVIAVSRTDSHLQTLKKEVKTCGFSGPSIKTIAVDVGDWKATQEALKDVGRVDLLVNNAAIMELLPFGEMTEEEVDRTLNINLKAVVNISQIVVKGMKDRGTGGSIVNVSSIGAKIATPGLSLYQGLKGGLDQLTRVMAVELGPHKIRVNTVNPTGVNTDLAKNFAGPDAEAMALEFLKKVPLGRFCETSDVADTIMYLLSDKASMIHGANIYVDGGHATSCG